MSEQELRIMRAIADTLRDIRQDIHTICNQVERNRTQQQPETEPTPVIRAELQVPDHIERSNQANSDREHRTQVWLVWATVAAFIAAAVYAGIARSQLSEIQEQDRPWIKIVDVAPTHQENFPTLRFFLMQLGDKRPPRKTVGIQLTVTIKNIGKGVAQGVFVAPILRFYKWDTTVSPYSEQTKICDTAASMEAPGAPFVWSAVFPNETRTSPISTDGFYEDEMAFHPNDRKGDWISGYVFTCVSYQAPRAYRTSVISTLMGERDRFIEIGKPVSDPEVHLTRDQRSEYAQ